jgi:hypothetical protein
VGEAEALLGCGSVSNWLRLVTWLLLNTKHVWGAKGLKGAFWLLGTFHKVHWPLGLTMLKQKWTPEPSKRHRPRVPREDETTRVDSNLQKCSNRIKTQPRRSSESEPLGKRDRRRITTR